MSMKDVEMFELLLKDKGKRYRVVIDNDMVWIEDKQNNDEMIHEFSDFGDCLLQQVLKQIGLDAEMC